MIEEWKEIKWYNWMYKISNKGRISSNARGRLSILTISVRVRSGGVALWLWKSQDIFNVHKLVAEYFKGVAYSDPRIYLINKEIQENWLHDYSVENIWLYPSNILKRHKEWLRKICSENSILLEEEVLSSRRDKYIQETRAKCYLYLYGQWVVLSNIWAIFKKNHAAIIYTLNKYQKEEYQILSAKYK